MAWTLGVPVVMAWTLGTTVIQPALEENGADDVGSVEASGDVEGSGWESSTELSSAEDDAFAETDADSETETETSSATGATGATGSISANTAAPSNDLEPIEAAPSGGGIEPFRGRFGVGAIRTIAGLNGINARYFITDKFMIGGSAGVALFSYREDDPESTDPPCPDAECNLENTRTVAFMAFNIEGLYFLNLGREAGRLPFRADFGVGGRFGVITSANATDVNDNLDDATELHIEIPLVFQLMFGNNFALSPELGMDFRIVPGSREEGDSNPGFNSLAALGAVDGPGFGWDLTPGIGLFGGASMHYYF